MEERICRAESIVGGRMVKQKIRLSLMIGMSILLIILGTQIGYAQSGDALIGARFTILTDGTPPFEDHGVVGVHESGDDIDANNGIVRTMDKVTYLINVSVNDNPAENFVIQANLPAGGDVIWDLSTSTIQAQMDAICVGPSGWSLSADKTEFTCDMGTQPEETKNFAIDAYVNAAALDGSSFAATLVATADNGIPHWDTNECMDQSLSNGCQQTSPDLTVSAHFDMETVKFRSYPNYDGINPSYVYENGGGVNVRWDLVLRYGMDGDYRGSSIPDETSIDILDDFFQIWEWGDASQTPLSNSIELVNCNNQTTTSTRYGTLYNYVNPNETQQLYGATQADWTCSQTAPGDPIQLTVSNLDLDREPPVMSSNGVDLPEDLQGVVALGQVTTFVPVEDADVGTGRSIGMQNCFAMDPTTGTAEFNPLDTGGNPANDGVPEDLSNNCDNHRIIVRSIPGPGLNSQKRYYPCYGDQSCYYKSLADGVEFYSQFSFYNNQSNNASADVLNFQYCDMFDNRTQFLRAEAFLTSDPVVGPVLFEYGVGNWGLESGIPYDQSAPTDASWYNQATAHCTDTAPIDYHGEGKRWYSASEIDWTNSATPGSGMVNANEINFVRITSLKDLVSGDDRLPNIYGQIPLQARDNNAGDYYVNYQTHTWEHSETGVINEWENYCNNIDRINLTCPNPPVHSSFLLGPYYHSDHYVHVEQPIDITKRTLNTDHTAQAGGIATWELTITTDFPIEYPAFPPGEHFIVDDVVITDELPPELTYIAGTTTLDGASFPDPVITDTGSGQELVWQLGDIPVTESGTRLVYETQVSGLVLSGTQLLNTAHVDSPEDPRPERCNRNSSQATKCHMDYVQIITTAAAAVEKVTVNPYFAPGDELLYNLRMARLVNVPLDWIDVVDILPYNGDTRGSEFDGPIELTAVTPGDGLYTGPEDPYTIWASNIAPSVLDSRGGSFAGDDYLAPATAYGGEGQGLGGADWPCELSEVFAGTCSEISSASQITAVRIYAPNRE